MTLMEFSVALYIISAIFVMVYGLRLLSREPYFTAAELFVLIFGALVPGLNTFMSCVAIMQLLDDLHERLDKIVIWRDKR